MVAQIFTGVNVIAFYSSELFRDPQGATDSKRAAWLSFGAHAILPYLYLDCYTNQLGAGFGISNVMYNSTTGILSENLLTKADSQYQLSFMLTKRAADIFFFLPFLGLPSVYSHWHSASR
jgi:hypothetical protein